MNNLSWIEKLLRELNAEVTALYRRSQYDKASEVAHKSLRIARQTYGPRHQYVTTAQENIKAIQRAQNNLDQAREPRPNAGGTKPRREIRQKTDAKTVFKAGLMVLMGFVFLTAIIFFDAPSLSPQQKIGAMAAPVSQSSTVRPFYDVQCVFDPDQRLVRGQLKASFALEAPREQILFNLYLNRYQNTALNNSQVRQYALQRNFAPGGINIKHVHSPGGQLTYQQQGEYLIITPQEGVFDAGEQQINMEFEVRMPQGSDRAGGNQQGFWLGHWLPTLAVHSQADNYPHTEIGDPYVDYAATYAVMFVVPDDYHLVLSDTRLLKQQQNTKVYTGTLKMVRDLPVFLHKGYQKSSLRTQGVEINYYHLPGNFSQQVLPTARQAVDYYTAHVGHYPWQQLNVVENDMYLSGMEYATMVLISRHGLSHNPVGTVFHEVGHQWFYNIIGSDQYRYGFLDEGLVEFMTKRALGRPLPDYNPQLPDLKQGLNQFANWQQYREVHYAGGESYFANLYHRLGEKDFDNFMRMYYRSHQYDLVTLEKWQHFVASQTGLAWDQL